MISDVIDLIEVGQRGEAVYIPTRFSRLGRHFSNRRAIYTYIGGDSGTGKSAFAHQTYIRDPIDWMIKNPDSDVKLKIFAWLMERPIARTKAKWVCAYLWETYGILIDTNFLLGEGVQASSVPPEIVEKVKEAEAYFDRYNEFLELHHHENPEGIRKRLKAWAQSNGKMVPRTQKDPITGELRTWNEYVPNDPKLITILLVDHIGILGDERGMNHKQKLDKMSEYGRIFRDRYGFSPVFVNQFNRNKSDSIRRTKMVVVPEDSDFDGSSNPFKDCDLALGLLDPNKLNIKDHFGYKVPSMVGPNGSRFRSITIMKNTYGPSDMTAGMRFMGECGSFDELPRPTEMSEKDYRDTRDPQTNYSVPI